ncbi:MAG: oligosaccharide flippase family protein [Bacillota bacterium]|nr:oligosaccharide flippase family protein [Bacillota bacterium]
MPKRVDREAEERVSERETVAPGFSFRKLFSDLAVYSSGTLLIKGMSVISAPIFTRLFDPDQYGAWSFINVAVAFLTGILMLGGDNAYTRYFFRCRTEEEKQTLTTTWFTFLAAWSVVVIAAALPFSRTLAGWVLGTDQYRSAMVIGFLSAPPAMINLILSQVLRNRFQARAFTTLNVMTAALTLILAVFFVLSFEMGVAGALLGAASAAVLMIPVRLWLVRDLLRFRFSITFLKQLLLFGLPLVPMNIAFWLLSNADRIMLARLTSLEAVGLYSIAASMAAVLMLLQNAVGQSWLPHAIKVYEEENRRAETIISRTMVYFLAGSAVVVTGFAALAQEVLFILVPPVYYGAFVAIPFLAIGFHFFTTAHVSVVGIMVKDKTVYIMIACWLVAVINIGLNALLIPRFGISGAAAATGSSYILFALGYAIASRKIWPVHYPGTTVAALLAVVPLAVGLIAMIALKGPGPVLNFLLKMVVLAAVVAVVVLIVIRSEGMGLREGWRRVIKRSRS